MDDFEKIHAEMEYMSKRERKLLAEGVYRGVPFYVLSYGTHPCGYVNIKGVVDAINTNHISCNGGINYSRDYLYAPDKIQGWFLGWDYIHCWDYSGFMTPEYNVGRVKHTTSEIIEDCKDVINQILELERGVESEQNAADGD